MRLVEISPTTWNENCRSCGIANKRVLTDEGDIVVGRPESLLEYLAFTDRPKPRGFDEWAENPVVTGELWYCPQCETLWDVNGRLGYSIKCNWNGEIFLSNDIINMPSYETIIPPQPTPLHTLCTCCNIWRDIISEDIVYEGTTRKVARTHRCAKCCIASIEVNEEPEVEEMREQATSAFARDNLMGI